MHLLTVPTRLGGESTTETVTDFKKNNLNQLQVFDCFHQARAKGIPITGTLLKAKAMEFAWSLKLRF